MRREKYRKKMFDEYEKRADEILKRMYTIITRTQRKQDDVEYRTLLEKVHTM
jgi:hypothetical protein